MQTADMGTSNIDSAWAATSSILKEFDFHDIKDIVRVSGCVKLKSLNNLGYDHNNWYREHKGILISDIERCFLNLEDQEKSRFLSYVIEGVFERIESLCNLNYDPEERLQYYLNRLGWQLVDKKLLPIDILDLSELKEINPAAQDEMIKAAIRFRDGDLNGAITSACAAVENLIEITYDSHPSLGEIDYSKSFESRCKKALEAIGIYNTIDNQLTNIEWKKGDVKLFKSNLKGSIDQATYVLQSLRNNMSDVHTTKPVIKPLIFDGIKWAQIILRLLSEKYDYTQQDRTQ